MATYKWTGTGGSGDYNDARNWALDNDTLPYRSAPSAVSAQAPAATAAPPTNPAYDAYDAYLAGHSGATADRGETDDPLTDGVTYAGKVYYIDSENGSDSNTGLSPDRAWKTLEQAQSKFKVDYWDTRPANAHTDPPYHDPWTPAPSESAFLFKRGGTYEGHISIYPYGADNTFENNYTFGAYGDRDDPRPVIINDSNTAAVIGREGHTFEIRNLHFVDGPDTTKASGMMLNGTIGVKIVNVEVEGFDQSGIGADRTVDLTIENSVVYNNKVPYGGGFAGGGDNLKILNSSFIDNGTNGMFGHDVYLRYLSNAVFEGNLVAGGSALGLVIHGTSDGIKIRGNEFYGNNNGIDISGHGSSTQTNEVFNNLLIEDNIIHGNGLEPGQQGYGMMIRSVTNAVIRDNLIYDNRLGALSLNDALAGDQQSANVQFYNNLFSGVVNILGSKTTDLSFANSIFTASGSSGDSFALKVASTFPDAQLTLDYNLYFMPNKANGKVISFHNTPVTLSALASSFGQEVHGINADPKFVDASAHNYNLRSDSPAIDRGVTIPGATDDSAGTPRPQGHGTDIGPSEYTSGTVASTPQTPAITSFSMDRGIVAGGIITSDNTLVLNGTAKANSTVKVYDGVTWLANVTVDANGLWSFTTPALGDGAHQLVVSAADAAGALSNVLSVLVDATAPTVSFGAVSGKGNPGAITLSGVTSDNGIVATVEVFNGDTSLGIAKVDNTNHTWSLSTVLAAGTYDQLKVTAVDSAGNVSSAVSADRLSIGTPAPSGTRETIWHADGSKEILVTGITGQKWTSAETAYGANGKAVSQVWSNGENVVRSQTWDPDGSIHSVHHYGITGQAYTDYEVIFGANNKSESAIYSNGMTAAWTYKPDGSFSLAYDHVQGQSYTSFINIYDPNLSSSSRLAARESITVNGAQTVRGYENGLTFEKGAGSGSIKLPGSANDIFDFDFNANTTMIGGGANTSFVFQSGFGKVTITDFVAHSQPNSDNDTIAFGHGLFRDFADLQSHMTEDAKTASTTISDGHGNSLTLNHTLIAQLHASDFILL